jgi:hypothetical protein
MAAQWCGAMAGLRFFKVLKTMNKIGHTRLSSAIRIVSVSVVRGARQWQHDTLVQLLTLGALALAQFRPSPTARDVARVSLIFRG